jgi:MinD-like ATPase involved in chromosome partitioning or flagellar assembly/CheY-like chemotaxis protein
MEQIESLVPDLVILDIMLPGMSGIEVCQRLRAQAKTENLPILMLSARAEVPDRIKGLEAGADDYVTKPFAMDELLARVAALLARSERLQAAPEQPTGRVIGLVGAKGGVGTTTVAVNLALALSRAGDSVIAAELRPHVGTMALHWGLKATGGWSEAFEGESGEISSVNLDRHLSRYSSGLRVLLGPQSMQEDCKVTEEQASALLAALATRADFVVADLSSGNGHFLQAAARHCARLLIVLEPTRDAVLGAEALRARLSALGLGLPAMRAVVVHRTPLALPVAIPQIEQRLGCAVLGAVPPTADTLQKAVDTARPLVVSAPDSLAAEVLLRIAAQLREALAEPAAKQQAWWPVR